MVDNRQRPLLHGGERLRLEVERPPTGGGDKFEPISAVESVQNLRPQFDTLQRNIAALQSDQKIPGQTFVEAKLLPNYLSASSFPGRLLNQLEAVPVGSKAAEGVYRTSKNARKTLTRNLILAVPDDSLPRFERLLQGIPSRNDDKTVRSAFEDFKKISAIGLPVDSIDIAQDASTAAQQKGPLLWEVVLSPVGLRGDTLIPATDGNLEQLTSLANRTESSVEEIFIRAVAGLTFVPIRATYAAMAEIVNFNLVRNVRPMPEMPQLPTFGTRARATWSAPSARHPRKNDFRVAVFDGGLDVGSNAGGHIAAEPKDLSTESPNPADLDHGTAVTAAALYGLLDAGGQANQPALPVDSFRVLPAPYIPEDLHGYWVLDKIIETVEQGDHKIVNLSLGPNLPVDDQLEPNRWTAELDALAWEKDVLFVVAAGNDGHHPPETGLNRVQVPADMVNGFTVGASDVLPSEKNWKRACYSSVGPGRWGGRVQPIGVQFGGSPEKPFKTLSADGTFKESMGTSFAAPLVTNALSELAVNLPYVNANILRAFGAHFAERPSSRHNVLRPEVGYGRLPLDFPSIMTCSADETHVLFRDEVARDELAAYSLPVPQGLSGKIEFRITLAYLTPVEPAEATEYTKSSIDMTFRPHQYMHRFTCPTTNKSETLNRRTEEALNRISMGWKQSQEAATKSLGSSGGGQSEVTLRDAGKWESLRHYRFSIDASQLDAPRLELSYLARSNGRLDNSPPDLPFALLVTIADKSLQGQLYDSARAQFSQLQPAVSARTQVGVRSAPAPLWQP